MNFKNYFKKYFKGGALTIVGYILSPLSFWNDFLVNIPIAYGLSYLLSFLIKGIFLESMIFFYWVSNVVGMLMMHFGIKNMVSKENKLTKKDLIINILVSIGYTLLIVILIKLNILKLPFSY
ncbi:hypothetical protein GW835_00695 [archaeon]|nr:hypothetical protein [archaeon]NCP79073.1 hypothetical protein [archaeon]NCP97545.1 hypothetical protein [archaeon]NCQ06840.1 hypothetical protein [archaeon]NCQ50636.1 hypothetical protein [archaeon]